MIFNAISSSPDYWDALARHHAAIEDNYLDRASVRLIIPEIQQPVLVVGAGQGLLVEELLRHGLQTDGVDLSAEMIKFAKTRRGLEFIHADARTLPFGEQSYQTIIYATGVIDFMGDEELIGEILNEARRITKPSGKIFVAFYRLSVSSEEFITKLGLLKNHVLYLRESLELYRLKPFKTIAWIGKKAGVSYFRALIMSLRSFALSPLKEKMITFNMQKIFRDSDQADLLISTAPEKQPYRNQSEIKNLFQRLAIPIKQIITTSSSCYIVQI